MPLPILLGAAALTALSSYKNHQTRSKANDIINSANERHDRKREFFEFQEKSTKAALELLNKEELEISKKLDRFHVLANELLEKINKSRQERQSTTIPTYNLPDIKSYSTSAPLISSVISSISLITAWIINCKNKELLENAKRAEIEINSATSKIQEALHNLRKIEHYALNIHHVAKSVCWQFDKYAEHLEHASHRILEIRTNNLDPEIELAKLCETTVRAIGNGFALATILVDLITTPLFKVKKVNGLVITDQNNIPLMATDPDGLMILDSTKLDEMISKADAKAQEVEPA